MDENKVLLKFDYMKKDDIMTSVLVYKGGKVVVKDFTDIILNRPFGVWGSNASFEDVINFLDTRCLPKSRVNFKDLFESDDISSLSIIKSVNYGAMACDDFWIRLDSNKDMTWNDILKEVFGIVN